MEEADWWSDKVVAVVVDVVFMDVATVALVLGELDVCEVAVEAIPRSRRMMH